MLFPATAVHTVLQYPVLSIAVPSTHYSTQYSVLLCPVFCIIVPSTLYHSTRYTVLHTTQYHSTRYSLLQYPLLSTAVPGIQYHSTWYSVLQYPVLGNAVACTQYYSIRYSVLQYPVLGAAVPTTAVAGTQYCNTGYSALQYAVLSITTSQELDKELQAWACLQDGPWRAACAQPSGRAGPDHPQVPSACCRWASLWVGSPHSLKHSHTRSAVSHPSYQNTLQHSSHHCMENSLHAWGQQPEAYLTHVCTCWPRDTAWWTRLLCSVNHSNPSFKTTLNIQQRGSQLVRGSFTLRPEGQSSPLSNEEHLPAAEDIPGAEKWLDAEHLPGAEHLLVWKI